MKTKVFLSIALRIIILFVVAMFATFIPDYLKNWFGDSTGYWGDRHYWFNTLMGLLFCLSLANITISIVNILKKEYPNL